MIHNTHLSQWIPANAIAKTAGTWTPTLSSNVASDVRGAADANFTLLAPIALPGSANLRNGARLKSVDVFYKVATAALDDFATLELERVTLPAGQAAPSGAALTVTADSAHDTAAKRKAVGDHVLTVTLSAPVWLTSADALYLALVVDAAATSVFTLYGARANFDYRID